MTSGRGLLAVDWGGSNLRAWRLGPDGAVEARLDLPLGVTRLRPGEAAARFESDVRSALAARDLPALLCGMIGSTLGWRVAPYVDCPASLNSVSAALLEVAPGVRIAPGLRCEGLAGPDVMRGEETQVLGWLRADPARQVGAHLLCLPGTHSKWVVVEEGRVSRFVTAMTGELYELLGAHSILRFGETRDDPDAFLAGAAAAGDGGALSARLFTLRGLTLAGRLAAESAGSWLSGLLIGAEIAGLRPLLDPDGVNRVELIGDERLCGLYARALAARSVATSVTAGEVAVLDGLRHIWKTCP